ncbi:putative disease resistance rpp13-like protein 1 [Quercus suber]|uniref:Disease resistance rpp13-like protein 1 n=1 Tax=Quercus suber TaxID=58331 RepID=A0AAW0L108_QUESU
MGRKRDRFWDYAEDLKGRFKCNYCKHEFPGGASRIKSHLAGVKGRDIVICDVVPEDVQKEAYKATQETNKKHKNASTSSNDKEGTLASTSISTIQKEKFVTQRNEEYMAEIVLDDVVDGLPHPNLKSLTIVSYRGKKFPSWVGSLLYQNLIEIYLIDCRECEEIPTLGHLPCLRVLEITAMEELRSIGNEFYSHSDGSGRNTTTLFPALRKLRWHNMKNLEEWTDAKELTSAGDLPDSLYTCASLQKLEVSECHELRYLPGVPSIIFGEQCYAPLLQYLENGDCLPFTSSIHPSLQKLTLCDSPQEVQSTATYSILSLRKSIYHPL